MKCIFFKPSIKIFSDKDEINLETKDNIEDIFVIPNKNYIQKI